MSEPDADEREARFRAAVEGSLDAFFVFSCARDESGEIVDLVFADLNTRAAEVIGLPRAEILGQRLCELRPVNRESGFFERYVEVFRTGMAVEEETVVRLPDGSRKWVHHQVIPLPDGVAITSRDVTRYRQLEVDLRVALARAEEAAATLREQQETILALSVPIVEAWEGVLALPVIGAVSEARAQQMLERLLEEIVRRGALFAILDLTGMGAVDAGCMRRLLSVSQAAGLLGCRCLLSGISGEVARRMIEAGAEGAEVPTFGRLRDALRYALAERRRG